MQRLHKKQLRDEAALLLRVELGPAPRRLIGLMYQDRFVARHRIQDRACLDRVPALALRRAHEHLGLIDLALARGVEERGGDVGVDEARGEGRVLAKEEQSRTATGLPRG